MSKLKVVNLYGGPGAGKSNTRGGLYSRMGKEGYDVEEVYEYAKTLTWEGRTKELENQLKLLSKQYTRQRRLIGQTEWVITDSPIGLCIIYRNEDSPPSLASLALEVMNEFENINILLKRPDTPYKRAGRNQDENEARQIDVQVRTMLDYHHMKYYDVQTGPNTETDILKILQEWL